MKTVILAVDDDPLMLKLIRDIGDKAGYEVITAADGKQGVEAALKHKPALILMDIMMPEMDGYAAVAQLKSQPETRGIPVIMLTAIGYEINRALALKMGASDYVTKPFDIKQLLALIKSRLESGEGDGSR